MLLIDDVLAGFVKGYFKNSSNADRFFTGKTGALLTLKRSIAIWRGLFNGSFSIILSRFTWEILQTVIGFFWAHAVNWFRPVKNIVFTNGVTVLEGGGWGGSVSLGSYIMLYPGYSATPGHYLFMHEFGHSLQSRQVGPLYLFKYGIPSLLTHNDAWMEQDANFRAVKHFSGNAYMEFAKQKMTVPQFKTSPKWWEYLLLFLGIGVIIIPYMNTPKNALRKSLPVRK